MGHSGGPVTNRMKYTHVRPLGAQEDNYVRLNFGPSLQNIRTKKGARVLSYFKADNDTVSGAFEYTNNKLAVGL